MQHPEHPLGAPAQPRSGLASSTEHHGRRARAARPRGSGSRGLPLATASSIPGSRESSSSETRKTTWTCPSGPRSQDTAKNRHSRWRRDPRAEHGADHDRQARRTRIQGSRGPDTPPTPPTTRPATAADACSRRRQEARPQRRTLPKALDNAPGTRPTHSTCRHRRSRRRCSCPRRATKRGQNACSPEA